MSDILKKRVRGDVVAHETINGPFTQGLRYQDFSDVEIIDVSLSDSPDAEQGFRFHGARHPPSLKVGNQFFNLIMRECNVERVGGDGIYATGVNGALIENCKVVVSRGKAADCCQFAYQNDDRFISRDVWLRGNIFTHATDTESAKGALVCDQTENYRAEYCLLEGHNFAYSSIGNNAMTRSCLMRTGEMNTYSFGYGIGSSTHLHDHHVYDCVIENARRAVAITGFKDKDVMLDGVTGAQRGGIVVHDNILSGCDIGFFADRPWSGSVYRNIFMKCKEPVVIRAFGTQVVTSNVRRGQVMGPIYANDGSFLCKEAPQIKHSANGELSVTEGRWSSPPEQISYVWRESGIDLMVPQTSTFKPDKAGEYSCVVLARTGSNWMLAVAEAPWPKDGYVPRSWKSGDLPWGNRYHIVQ
ncbi:right-handed parallel beta-helix repeat-containing protein [Agrobacterium cavarae]|uniref:right-handed parallel beta-helix repeat-containing protein n=1 Tax=Agrobacterium cavarae TaxID=2528239 RepID=UPI000DD04131|nr:right-handed parallel beta-helix repeat-containing protein [Agrobacterium cavarae]